MPTLKTGSGEEFALIDENETVGVIVTGVEENNFTHNDEKVEKLRWTFDVTDQGPWQGRSVNGDTTQVFTAHPNCKAYNWASAILGRSPEPGEEFDTDDLVGMSCRILIGHRTDKQGRTWMKVKEVMGPRSGATAAPAPTTPPDEAPF